MDQLNLESLILPLITIPTVLITKSIDFEQGDRKFYLLAFWGAFQVLNLVLCLLIRRKILQANEQRTVSVPVFNLFSNPNQKKEKQFLSIKEYDLKEWQKSLLEVLTIFFVNLFVFVKFGGVSYLVLGAALTPYRIFKSKLFRIHFLNQTADDLVRPFKTQPNQLMKMFKGMKQELGMSSTEPKRGKKKPKKPSETQRAALRIVQETNSSPKQPKIKTPKTKKK
eukprot:TRINITY_DN3156_c0_g1_i1.p1 TRINITY_DN3156_c0_g1~~TRINITY_DN3156_c0_g1_i1.p1  ORF type:complete len:242 (+),score=43.53 TRINITY_DN3156_c0_g1_i1:56-727(+)